MTAQQSEAAARKNSSFFADNDAYAESVSGLTTYRNVRAFVDREVAGLSQLLDVGNGGVFDYDVTLVDRITAVDLFLDEGDRDGFPENVTPRRGNALKLDEPSGLYDGVLLVNVFHHLVGRRARDVERNAVQALAEAERVLAPGGKLIIVESCVPAWFYAIERLGFAPLAAFAGTPLMDHPPTVQLTFERLRSLAAARFALERAHSLPMGRWILQFGRRWPSALTPARHHAIVARKRRA